MKHRLTPQIRFLLLFGAIAAVLFGAYCFPYKERGMSEGLFHTYLSGYAHFVGMLLSWIDPSIRVTENVLSGRFSMAIIKTCDAMEVNILLVSATAAFPAPWRRKAIVLPVALVLLVLTNVFRLVALYLIGIYMPSAFEVMHFEVFPLVMVAAAALLFVGSIRVMAPPTLNVESNAT